MAFPEVIYLDTEPLVASGWPSISRQLRELRDAARAHSIVMVVPDGVLAELRQQFNEHVAAHVEGTFGKLRKYVGDSLPSIDKLLKLYDSASTDALRELGAERAPLCGRSLQHFFDAAVERQKPFRAPRDGRGKDSEFKDAGFKDAVIWWSCVDHLERSGRMKGILVSANRDFVNLSYCSDEGRSLISGDIPSVMTGLARKWEAASPSGLGWIRFPFRTVLQFDLMTPETRLTNLGGEAGNVEADRGPFKAGERVRVGSFVGGSFIGSGPVIHKGRRWERLYYWGELKVTGPSVVAPARGISVDGSVICEGFLTAGLSSPQSTSGKAQLRVNIRGEGRTTINFYPVQHDESTVVDFLSQDYFLDQIDLAVLDVQD
jgi:hypothetical protein